MMYVMIRVNCDVCILGFEHIFMSINEIINIILNYTLFFANIT